MSFSVNLFQQVGGIHASSLLLSTGSEHADASKVDAEEVEQTMADGSVRDNVFYMAKIAGKIIMLIVDCIFSTPLISMFAISVSLCFILLF